MAATPEIIRLKYSTDSEASIAAAIATNGSHPISKGELVVAIGNGQAKLYTYDFSNTPVPVVSGFPFGVDGGDFDVGSFPIMSGSRFPRLGTTPATSYDGWTRVLNTINTTASYFVPTTFTFYFNNTAYSGFYVNRASLITFGGSTTAIGGFAANSPSINKIFIEPGQGYFQRIYTQVNSAFTRVRVEADATFGTALGSSDLIYEFTIVNPAYTSSQLMELRTSGGGYVSRDGLFMIANSTTAFASEPDMLVGESWVFEGNSSGNAWTMHDYSYIDVQAN